MNQSRRDMLKYFAAGTIIAAVGSPGAAQARLIQPPKAELILPEARIVKPFCTSDISRIDISFHMNDGQIRHFDPQYVRNTRSPQASKSANELDIAIEINDVIASSPMCFANRFSARMWGPVR